MLVLVPVLETDANAKGAGGRIGAWQRTSNVWIDDQAAQASSPAHSIVTLVR